MTTVQTNNVSPELLAAMSPAKNTATDTAAAAQDRFMTLLVTQMKNQDPLNPLDNAQVTSQLAQLSTVTGIDKLNTTLQALQGSYQTSQSLQAAGMIGHGVFAIGSSLTLTEGKSLFGVELPDKVDNLKVKISDKSGNVVHEIDLGPQEAGLVPFQWDGSTGSGTPAKDGKYSFAIIATRAGESAEATALSFGEVSSVATGVQGVKLDVQGLGEVSLADIRKIL
jgi:flagellar basal-body rod modification protein FlgD